MRFDINSAQMPYRVHQGKRLDYRFPSFGHFLNAVEKPDPKGCSFTNTQSFTGTKSYGEAFGLAKNGWMGVDETIRAISHGMVGALGSLIPDLEWIRDVTGEALDVGTFLMGVPECYVTPDVRMIQGNRVFRILVPIGGNCTVAKESFQASGACAVAMAQLIEKAGHQSEITAVWESCLVDSAKLDTCVTAITVKEPGQPLDVPLLAFQVANPSMLRRLCFRLYEGDPLSEQLDAGYGYGRSSYSFQTDGTLPNDICLPTPEQVDEFARNGGRVENLIPWLQKKLTDLGVIA